MSRAVAAFLLGEAKAMMGVYLGMHLLASQNNRICLQFIVSSLVFVSSLAHVATQTPKPTTFIL